MGISAWIGKEKGRGAGSEVPGGFSHYHGALPPLDREREGGGGVGRASSSSRTRGWGHVEMLASAPTNSLGRRPPGTESRAPAAATGREEGSRGGWGGGGGRG